MKYFIIIIFIVLTYNVAAAENLIKYHRDAAHEHYYDKNSIIYPALSIVGNKPDKSIVEVWDISESISTKGIKRTRKRINCNTRRISVKQVIENGVIKYNEGSFNATVVQTNSADYYLFKELCITSRYR